VVFVQDKDKFPRHIGLVALISRSPQPSKIIICTTVAQYRKGQVPSRLIECKVWENISPKKEE
jgi:hypothetical protein